MPTHAEQRRLPHPREQLFALVADIDRYHEFLPWCVASRVNRREGNVLTADLVIGYKFFREKFTSRVTLLPPDRIDVTYENGPFKYLTNRWRFLPADGPEATLIDFYVDFQFRSALLEKLIGTVFTEAVHRMVRAFEERADAIYGPANGQPAPRPA
ncbi:MAG: type II toxin-antitoxin system RatA family toxin [Alphaproteobacteria bacterium]|nr:type II toxin-antitoxin system RatA family toxin [Alphaproteobacteria bacterium]